MRLVGWVVSLVGCSSFGGGNAPPAIAGPAEEIVMKEDHGEARFEVIATDPDGDALSVFATGTEGGAVTVFHVEPIREGGTMRVVAGMSFRPGLNFYGAGEVLVRVSDGAESTEFRIPIAITPVNDEPLGVADAFAAAAATPIEIHPSTLLANDSDVDAAAEDRDPDELAVVAVGYAYGGTVTLASGRVTFVPQAGFRGTAHFEYTLSDGVDTRPVPVRVHVDGPNAAPTAVADEVRVMEDERLHLRPPALTSNDIDHDGESLQVIAVGQPTHGTVELVDGWVHYTPAVLHLEPATFTYTVTDGAATSTATVRVEIVPWITVATARPGMRP